MNNLYLAIINQLDNGIILLDDNLNIQLWNDWLEKFTGQTEESVKDQYIAKVAPKLKKEIYIQMFRKALNNGQKSFCSAAMHEYFLEPQYEQTKKIRQNMLIRHINFCDKTYVLLEIHDVTNHYERVRKLNKSLQNSIDFTKSLERFAYYDSLTNLPNRKYILDYIESLVKKEDAVFTLFFLDLNRFKEVNDSFGHAHGDYLLKMLAERVQKCLDDGTIFARLGGDEFVLLKENLLTNKEHDQQIEEINQLIVKPFEIEGQDVYISASIGYACFPHDGLDAAQLLSTADRYMYMNKKKAIDE